MQTDDESLNKVTFTFLHGTDGALILPRTGVGVAVKYAVEYADSPDFNGTPTPVQAGDNDPMKVSVELPTGTTKVRYYRPKFIFE